MGKRKGGTRLKTIRTTEKQFKFFKKCVRHYMKAWGIDKDWHPVFYHQKPSVKNGMRKMSAASIRTYYENKAFIFPIGKKTELFFNKSVTVNSMNDIQIETIAFHEVLHMVFNTFRRGRNICQTRRVVGMEHKVIEHLEILLFRHLKLMDGKK